MAHDVRLTRLDWPLKKAVLQADGMMAKTTHPFTRSSFVLFCFFCSGVAGLIYEILWQRMIDKVVGSAPFAVATVLSVFMGGLALGSWLAARHIDTIKSRRNLLSLYGKVELAIGIYAILLPLFISLVKPAYILAYNNLFMHFWLYRIFTFFGCCFLLLVPAALMGVTLPVLCRFYIENLRHIGARTGKLYGINTIGGAAGALLCGFFLIAELGMWGSLLTAVCINILIGGLCIWLAKGSSLVVSESVAENKIHGPAKRRETTKAPKQPEAVPVPEQRKAVLADNAILITLALWIFGISGFCSMAYEVIWTRLLGLIIGPTTYSFSLVVSTFIIGLALGNILFGWLADRIREIFRLLVITQICAACLALLVSQFLGHSQFLFSKLIYTLQGDFGKMVLVQSMILFFLLVGPTVFLGATFPLVSRIYARSLPDIGKSIGTAYAMNTVGAILGSFAAGFILIPLLGKENGLRTTAGLQIAISLLALTYLAFKTWDRSRAFITGLITLLLAALLLVRFPLWNHNILARGWYYRFEELAPYFRAASWFDAVWKGPSMIARLAAKHEIVFYGDGIGGFTTVEKAVDAAGTANFTLYNSGKADASSRTDRLSQALSAHIPLLFHPDPRRIMVLGLASGMTAGEALLYPVNQIDVLEINPQVLKASEFFTLCNNNCLANPKSRIIVQDGRNHLELTREKYDVIISEPSNPWMAGLANLFSLEYFETVKKRLNRNGIFAQWIHSYDMDWSSFAMVGRTFAEVFPDGILVKMLSADYLLVGFFGAENLDLSVAQKNISYARQSQNIVIKDPKIIFNLMVTENLKGFFGPGPLHTDNWPHLEFAAPKNLGRSDVALGERLAQGGWLSQKTREVVASNKSVDSSLDYLELMLADYSPPFKEVDLKKATPEQHESYQRIAREYCGNQYVTHYELFPNQEIRVECARIQVSKMKRHLETSREDSEGYVSLAGQLRMLGNTQDATRALQQAISLNPSLPYAYVNLGELLLTQGKLDEARAQLAEALRIAPELAEAHLNLGNVFAAQGRTGDAMEHYSRALRINPSNPRAHSNLGVAYASQGRTADAMEQFAKALAIDPGHGDAHWNLGRILAGQGQLGEALAHYTEALAVSPGSAEYHNEAGLVLSQLGRPGESISELSEALRINPKYFEANYNMGIALSNQGKPEEALGYFLKAADIRGADPDVHKELGTANARLGRLGKAAEHFSEALKTEPDSAEIHDLLGVVLVQMGRRDEAIGHFKKALEINNGYEPARDHLKTLKSGKVSH
jgi:spermidine synthase